MNLTEQIVTLRSAVRALLLPARIGRRTCVHFMSVCTGDLETKARDFAAQCSAAIRDGKEALKLTGGYEPDNTIPPQLLAAITEPFNQTQTNHD